MFPRKPSLAQSTDSSSNKVDSDCIESRDVLLNAIRNFMDNGSNKDFLKECYDKAKLKCQATGVTIHPTEITKTLAQLTSEYFTNLLF